MGGSALPLSVAEIDATWLTQALRGGGVIASARITSVSKQVIGEGEGFIGEIGRLTLDYDKAEPGAPRTLIAKVPGARPDIRALGVMLRLYEIEARFYQELSSQVPTPSARCYFHAGDGAGNFVLLLEDLAPGRVGNQLQSCAAADASTAVLHLADLHAAFWEHSKLETLTWVPMSDDPLRVGLLTGTYAEAWKALKAQTGDVLNQRVVSAGDRLEPHLPRLLAHLGTRPRTLNHGDYRTDNMFFASDAGGAPFKVIDWQAMTRGRGVFDLAYFITGCMATEDRRAQEDGLIRAYHRRLAERGVEDFSLDECRRDFRIACLTNFARGVFLFSTLDFTNERGAALAQVTLERTNGLFEDLAVDDLLVD